MDAALQQRQQQQQQQQQPRQQQQQQQHGQLHARRMGDRVHFCSACQTPIAIYGRLRPCLHAFCLTCASEMAACSTCQSRVDRLERFPPRGLFISPITLQGFTTEITMKEHTQKVYTHLMKEIGPAAPKQQQVQQQHRQTQARPVQR